MGAAYNKVKDFLVTRKQAYNFTFAPENNFAQKVLLDLAKFCRAHESTFDKGARAHAVAEGRREVWLRIQHQLQMSDDDLWELYNNPRRK